MKKNTILIPSITLALSLPLVSQSDYDYGLTKHKGNKIILLGTWNPRDVDKWNKTINADGIYEHGFILLNREKILDNTMLVGRIKEQEINAFEQWMRNRYAIGGYIKWMALDIENKLITFGTVVPSAKEFDEILDQKGIKTPLKQIREFLTKNPDHLDAKTDLLTEVRRRAIQKMPTTDKDLDTETDLRTWGVLAAETDNIFKGVWLGIDIRFFRPDKDQPERFSKLMKNVFRKHIVAVESAIREQPTDPTLWNIWAWMARTLTDYKWFNFISSIEPFSFPHLNVTTDSPSSDVCVWLIKDSMEKKDWDTVLKLAKIARSFYSVAGEFKVEWVPGTTNAFATTETIKDYPAQSAYAPNLEALLRLGKIDEANALYDEMIRLEGKTGWTKYQSNNAQIAANAAKAVGMNDLAKMWELGEPINKVPFLDMRRFNGFPVFYIFADFKSDYYNKFSELVAKLTPALRVISGPGLGKDVDTLGWGKDDGDRWALIGGDLCVLEQGFGFPDSDILQSALNRHDIYNGMDQCRRYMSKHGNIPGLIFHLAFEIIDKNLMDMRDNKTTLNDESNYDNDIWAEPIKYLRIILKEHPDVLINMPYILNYNVSIQNSEMKFISKPLLDNIETLLRNRPSSQSLWSQWIFWRGVEGVERPIEPLIESVMPSPLSKPGTVPPGNVYNMYYEECKNNERWDKIISLLKSVWDREYTRIIDHKKEVQYGSSKPSMETDLIEANSLKLGNAVGIPLIKAYIMESEFNEANDIFNAWLDCGGRFSDATEVIELAKTKGQEKLAREWKSKIDADRK